MGCGLDPVPASHLVPQCGGEGPVLLFEMSAEEDVWIRQVGATTDLLVIRPDRSMVVDRCGNVLAGVEPAVEAMAWIGDTLVTTLATPFDHVSDLHSSAGYGDASTPLLERAWLMDWGEWLAIERNETLTRGRLLRLRHDDGLEVTALLDDLRLDHRGSISLVPVGPRLLVQTVDDRAVSVDPRTGTSELVLPPAPHWTANERWLAYVGSPGPAGHRSLYVHDRGTGLEHRLASDLLGSWSPGMWFESDNVLVVTNGERTQRWFHLDPPAEVRGPPSARILAVHTDGAAWWFELEEDETLGSLWFRARGGQPRHVRDAQWTWRVPNAGGPFDFGTIRDRDPFVDVHRAFPDGRFVRVAIIDPTRYTADDGRYLTFRGGGDFGPLVLYDGIDPEGITVLPWADRDATSWSRQYGEFEDILYESDPATGTHGLFRARIATD